MTIMIVPRNRSMEAMRLTFSPESRSARAARQATRQGADADSAEGRYKDRHGNQQCAEGDDNRGKRAHREGKQRDDCSKRGAEGVERRRAIPVLASDFIQGNHPSERRQEQNPNCFPVPGPRFLRFMGLLPASRLRRPRFPSSLSLAAGSWGSARRSMPCAGRRTSTSAWSSTARSTRWASSSSQASSSAASDVLTARHAAGAATPPVLDDVCINETPRATKAIPRMTPPLR